MDIASLGLRVESGEVDKGTRSLDKLTAAAGKAERATDTLEATSRGAGAATRTVSSAADSAAAALQAESSAAGRAAGALQTVNRTMVAANGNVRRMSGSYSGLAAQFQDIGVTAAAGMSPMMVALQQGTQIAGQMEMAMASGSSAAGVFGAAFKSLLSPVTLVSVGLTALAVVVLQMINWTAVAKGALRAVAAALEVIAPYAVAAAAGLALLYAPAVIGGIDLVIAGLGGMATALWGIATAIYSVIGLPAILVAAFIALVAAAVIWRDDLTKMLGFDIVGAAKTGANFLIGAFIGGYNAIRDTWIMLPAVIGDVVIQTANNVINANRDMIKQVALDIANWAGQFSGIPGIGGGLLAIQNLALAGAAGAASGGEIANPYKGASEATGAMVSHDISSATQYDYIGKSITFVQTAASGAAGALKSLADGIDFDAKASKKAAKEAERQAKAYDKIVQGANQRIAASQLEAATLGMTTEQINAQRYAQELLNKAANDNIALTPQQTAELTALGSAMAAAEAATQRVKDAFDFAKHATKGFLSDLRQGLMNGEGFWQSFGNAALNVLNKIIDKVEGQLVDALFSLGSGAGGGGNIFSTVLGWLGFAKGGVFDRAGQVHAFARGGVVTKPTVFPFANGTGLMGEAGPEAIMPLRRGPDGRLGVSAANSNAANQNLRVHVTVGWSRSADGNLRPFVENVSQQTAGTIVTAAIGEYDGNMPGRINDVLERHG